VGLNAAERAVVDRIDEDALLATLDDLVAVRSVADHESPAQALVADFCEGAGLGVAVWPLDLDALSAHPAYSMEFARDEALGVCATLDGGDGPGLLFDAHVDVVPAGDPRGWSVDPWRLTVADGVAYGRGTCDTKGGLAGVLHALKAIADAGVEPPGPVHLASVVAEEDGGAGTLGLLDRGVRAGGAVVIEPTGLAVAPAQAGALSFRITVPGRAAHGALREEGVSALERFWPIHAALRDLEARRNAVVRDPSFAHLQRPFAICVGRIEAGDWASSEPDWLRAEGRYGIAPDESLDEARAEFTDAVAAAASGDEWLADHPPTVEWWGAQWLPARTPSDAAVVRTMTGAVSAVTGFDPSVEGVPYGADMGLTVGVGGIPSVIFGPGDIRAAHRPDEHVALADLLAGARALAVAALRAGAGLRPARRARR
jgi:acetylornithine deacetylase